MLTFDTNFLVRHLVGDDPRQAKQVAKAIADEVAGGRTVLLPDIVICETLWVLESLYGATRVDLLETLRALWGESVFEFECRNRFKTAMDRFENGKADFSDYLIAEVSKARGRTLVTFDKKLLSELEG